MKRLKEESSIGALNMIQSKFLRRTREKVGEMKTPTAGLCGSTRPRQRRAIIGQEQLCWLCLGYGHLLGTHVFILQQSPPSNIVPESPESAQFILPTDTFPSSNIFA
ncbi:unnamed protein product [Cylicostephanus goldi]|uniref:Uncharacterized protein n=1 Tax=Cylicostephanus goldi TaxID=71465 RepID=A0A3P7MEI2_CYLGO|nr:unnamed protein product [Cylicostephanus goldi]